MFRRLAKEWKNPSFPTRQLIRALACILWLIAIRVACYVFGWDPNDDFIAGSLAGLLLATLLYASLGIVTLGSKWTAHSLNE